MYTNLVSEATSRETRADFPNSGTAVKDPAEEASIPAGSFLMGADDGGEFEGPVREVYVSAFYMDATPVTNRQFRRFAEAAGHVTVPERKGEAWGYREGKFGAIEGLRWRSFATLDRDDHPVVLVAWEDAAAYAAWAGKRLPTEAEWEKAARGGLVRRPYPWGDSTPDGSQSNFAGAPGEVPRTTSVRQFPPNEYGVYDMVGNVWQWCSDWYGPDYYMKGENRDPAGPTQGENRVRRAGSWNVIQPFRLRCANRGAVNPASAFPNLGFRCCRSVEVS